MPMPQASNAESLSMPWHHNALRWRHNGHDGVSNHQPHECLLNHLFRRRSKKTSKFRITGLCAGNSPGTGEFPAQMASNAENVSILLRHHGNKALGGKGANGEQTFSHTEHSQVVVKTSNNHQIAVFYLYMKYFVVTGSIFFKFLSKIQNQYHDNNFIISEIHPKYLWWNGWQGW